MPTHPLMRRSSHSSFFLFLTFVSNPCDLYCWGEKVIVIILTGHGELGRLRAIVVSAIVCHSCACCSRVSTALGQENFFIVTLGNRFYLFAVSQMTVTNTIDTEYACSHLTWVLCSLLWTFIMGGCYSACSWHGSLDSCLMSVCSAVATWGVHTARVSGQHHRYKRTKTFCSSCWKGIVYLFIFLTWRSYKWRHEKTSKFAVR